MAASLKIEPGTVFGFLTVLQEVERHRKPNGAAVRVFECVCRCGTKKSIRLSSLKEGKTVSCGCFHKEQAGQIMKKVATKHGKSHTQIYYVWQAMIRRCQNPKDKSYPRYGALGIKVCKAWQKSFAAFNEYMGPRPDGLTLDRIDSKGNYEPGNVRWASYTEQARNTRRNRLHTIDGETKCFAEWCEILGVPWTTVKNRLRMGKEPFQQPHKGEKSE
jgi:hypothetical protein